ncbi:autotransporter outer membrane beta-barrel domain-containing protein [Pseudomonas retamae]|uniref:Autotransporter domain-containing protein n=1 Tax=Pseudomonas retamae TaxID=702110 RepID=A0ABW7D8B0_9PSED
MPAQYPCKPKHLALAIALAIGCVEASIAQQLETPVTAETERSKPRVKKPKAPKTVAPTLAVDMNGPIDDLFAIKEFIGPLEHTSAPALQITDAPLTETATRPMATLEFDEAFYADLEFPEIALEEQDDAEFDLVDPFDRDMYAYTTAASFLSSAVESANEVSVQLGAGDDLLVINNGARWSGRLDGGAGINGLQLNATEGGEIGQTRNFSSLRVARGLWTLSHAFDGDADIKAGAALVNSGSIGGVTVDKGAVFGGSGQVANLYVAGSLAATRLYGAPDIQGDLEFSEDAVFSYGVTAESGSDPVVVNGTAILGGAQVQVHGAPGNYANNTEHLILTANRIEGEFGEVTTNLAFMTPTLSYEEHKVNLKYTRNDVALVNLAKNRNSRSVADSIVEAGSATPSMVARVSTSVPAEPQATKPVNTAVTALIASDKTTAPIALEQLAAGSNANLAKATLSSITPVSASMLSAMQQLGNHPDSMYTSANSPRQASAAADTGRVWIQALGHGGKVDRDADSTLKHATQGLVLGADWRLDEQWHVGLIGGKSQTRLDARHYDGDLDSWHLGAYAVRQDGPLALRLGATHASHEGSSKRRVAFNGFSDRLQGNYNANTQQAFAELGYNFGRHNATLEPFASLGYQRYQRDSYREKGGDAALKVFGQTRDNLSSTFGLRTAHTTRLDNGMSLTPRFSAGWKHTFGEIDNDTRQQLIKGGKRFEIAGAALDRNSLSLDTGLDLGLAANHTVGVSLTAEAGNDSRTHGVMGQWRMAF